MEQNVSKERVLPPVPPKPLAYKGKCNKAAKLKPSNDKKNLSVPTTKEPENELETVRVIEEPENELEIVCAIEEPENELETVRAIEEPENELETVRATEEPKNEPESDSEPESETIDMFEIRRKVNRLHLCEDLYCERCLDHFHYIASGTAYYVENATQNVTQTLLQTGFMELVQHMLSRFFKKPVMEFNDSSSYAFLTTMVSVANMTDNSSEACRKVIQLELHTDIINLLKSRTLDPKQTDQSLSSTLCDLTDGLMKILHNVVQSTIEARELFREQGVIEVIQRFQTGTTDSLSCLAIMFLAWVINDEENSILNSDDKIFSFLNKQLRSAIDRLPHRSDDGHKAIEILAAINKLVVNDENKERMVKSGLLSSYVLFLDLQFDVEEQFLAAQGLWTLSFKCAEDIKQEKSCIESLELLLEKSPDDGVRRQVNGTLIALGVLPEKPVQASKLSSNEGFATEADEKRPMRIFISYQHSSKESVFKIRDRLRDNGYNVWLDADNICGSLGEDITDGIDKSSIVLTCLSQNYYESPYCKKEVIYADDNRKDIIPLTMEPKYKPHGWLKFRMADKLRIDFSQPQSFEDSLGILFRKLKKSHAADEVDGERHRGQPEVVSSTRHVPTASTDVRVRGAICEPEVIQTKAHSMSCSAPRTAGVSSWTKTDVVDWLDRNNFQHLMKWFDDYDGQLLLEFQNVLEKSPEFLAPSFIAAHSVKDFLRLRLALRKLL